MPSEPQVTVRTTEAGRVTEVVVPDELVATIRVIKMVTAQMPRAGIGYVPPWWIGRAGIAIRQPGGPDVVALAGETLRIAAGRVERVT